MHGAYCLHYPVTPFTSQIFIMYVHICFRTVYISDFFNSRFLDFHYIFSWQILFSFIKESRKFRKEFYEHKSIVIQAYCFFIKFFPSVVSIKHTHIVFLSP
jgi:hypothetical protein